MPAPKGNTNALKHGLYAKRIRKEVKNELRWMLADDLTHEIFAARLLLAQMYDEFEKAGDDVELKTKITTAYALLLTTLNSSMRTHAFLTGKEPEFLEALTEALQRHREKYDL